MAVFCPVAIFILTEVITRPRWRDGKLSFGIRVASTALVGLPVAVASYLHLCSLLEYYSSIPFIAYSLPLTVDGLMLACTAALQLTGPEPQQSQTDVDTASGLPPDVEAMMPRPRQPVDDAVLVAPGSPPGLRGPLQARTPVSAPTATDADEYAPVDYAVVSGGDTAGLSTQPFISTAPPMDAEVDASSRTDRPDGFLSNRRVLAAPPVSLVGPPTGTVLLPLQVLLPPRSTAMPGIAPPGGIEPPGRLGSSDLTDAQIIAVAMADKPVGTISATALVKSFGIGSGRAARLRDEIAEIREEAAGRRRLAVRLAAGFREVIERRRGADGVGPAEPPATAGE
ncbi:hypothetical protein [Catenulispora pinisilvae]|uniref:hypothetical protein n=1 Tax=Catenulispora pinisilvae TaxID=2705253 RepID=UPI001891FA2E|nr:hypothetical protein [Catenulispora pinisilvae]